MKSTTLRLEDQHAGNLDAVTTYIRLGMATTERARPMGCGRIYVSTSKEHAPMLRKAAKALGMIYQARNYYGDRYALYIGYDNCTGREWAQGEEVAKLLTALGMKASMRANGD